ncbi:hypothetical protein BC937DRAFT_95136 [Endogone sp. FLAS-F59071]|nr:hypothetical protein BC937DRAFT_95136 [Endogone sp. FLAS-F59071]|eukprot:RUS13556.1 hypothetical protein BC937DRAFT_95136 [Endogone sp. FLAS-F59071]
MGRPTEDWAFDKEFEQLMSITWDQFLQECRRIQTILIIDEVNPLVLCITMAIPFRKCSRGASSLVTSASSPLLYMATRVYGIVHLLQLAQWMCHHMRFPQRTHRA